MMTRRRLGLFIAVMVATTGCGASGSASSPSTVAPSAASAPASPTPPPPTAKASEASAAPSEAPGTPIPTFATTMASASTAPAGAIRVDLALPDGEPRFVPGTITAKAGTVVFFLRNVPGADAPDHDLLIGPADTRFFPDGSTPADKVLAQTPHLLANESATFTVAGLTPGTYALWCSVRHEGGSHASDGMVGTLTITP